MPLNYPNRLNQETFYGSLSGGLHHQENISASLLTGEEPSPEIRITGEKSNFVKQHMRSNCQTPRLGQSLRNVSSPIPHPINASSFHNSNNTYPLDPNLSNILKEHLDESLLNFLQHNPQVIDTTDNQPNMKNVNNPELEPQTSFPNNTSLPHRKGTPNLSVNKNKIEEVVPSSKQPNISIIREKHRTKPVAEMKKKPKYVPPTMDRAVRKKEEKLCSLVVPNKQCVEFPENFDFNEKHKSFIYNPEPTKSSFLERLHIMESKKKDRTLNYSIANQKEGKSIELFSNNEISYYNKSDFLLASEKFVKSEKERSKGGPIPQWNKISDNIPMGFIDDLNADYIIKPLDRSSPVPEHVEEPIEHETFFITGLNEIPNSSLPKTQKHTPQRTEMPELPSRISTPNYMLFTRDGVNLSQLSQRSTSSPNLSVNLSTRPHSTLSHHCVPSNNYLSNHSLLYQDVPPPRPNTSMDRTSVLTAKKKWNVFPPRQKIIVNNPNKPINSFVAEQSMNLSQSSSRMDFSRSTSQSTFRAKSSLSSRSVNFNHTHDTSEHEEIVIRLPDQCLISATSKPITNKPAPHKQQQGLFNKSQDRISHNFHIRETLNVSPINNEHY